MDGVGSFLVVGIGHDLQAIAELEGKQALLEPDVFFTESEVRRINSAPCSRLKAASFFSCKEAFFKAVPAYEDWEWTDVMVEHGENGKPRLVFIGKLDEIVTANGWRVDTTLSHSGDYVSSFVVITRSGIGLLRTDDV